MEGNDTQAAEARLGAGEGSATTGTAPVRSGRFSRGWVRFGLHLVEMLLAMGLGMAALEVLLMVVGRPPGYAAHPILQYGLMAVAMAAPMVAWMRLRGHSWSDGIAMSIAMAVPMFAVVLPVELGVAALSAGALMVLAHVLMVAGMVAWMLYRRDLYLHGSHR
jgi:hypothetical protein